MHTYGAGLVLAGGRMFEDGAQLARGFGAVGVLLVVVCALVSITGGDGTTLLRGTPLWLLGLVGCILLGVAAVGLVMMALGPSANGQL